MVSKQALTAKDFVAFKNITDAQISPDGKKVVYVVQETNLDKDKSENSLWLQTLGRGSKPAPARLTSHPADSGPRWAPDSERIAFTSKREDKGQLYVININGGEAQVIKTEKSPISTPLWSPDGKYIAFKAMVDKKVEAPRYAAEPKSLLPCKDEEKDKDDKEAKKDKIHVITDLHYRADGQGMIYDKYAQLFVVEVATGDCCQLTEKYERLGDFIWNKQGTGLLYLVDKFHLDSDFKYTTGVYEVDQNNKATAYITEFDGRLGRLDLSPDGRWLLLSGVDNTYPTGTGEAGLYVLDLIDQSLPICFDKATNLTAEVGTNCVNPTWAHTGGSIYFIKQWKGAMQFCQVLVEGSQPGQVVTLPISKLATLSHYSMAKTGSMVFVAQNFTTPPELYWRNENQVKQITEVNKDAVEKYHLCEAEKITYKSRDDWDVEGWLVKPLNYEEGKRYPAILNIHGGPTGAYFDSFQFSFQLLAQQGFAVVFTNPRGSITYGTKFAQGVCNDWGGGDYADIMAGVHKAVDMGVVDENRVGVTGWSYGGYMTNWIVSQTPFFKAAVTGASICSIYNLFGNSDAGLYAESLWGGTAFDKEEEYMERSAIRHVRQVETPLLIIHGDADVRCPLDQGEQFYFALKRLGKDVAFVTYPGEPHVFRKPTHIYDRWERTLAWFKYYLMEQS